MGVTYGITIASKDDRYIAMAEKALEGMARSASPGAFLVDLIPARESLQRFSRFLLSYYLPNIVKYVP